MKIPALSPGLATELALAVAVVGAAVWAAHLASQAVSNAAGAAVDTAKQAAWAVTPWNNDNVFAQAANSAAGAIVTDPAGPGKNADGSSTFGGMLYDLFNPGQAAAVNALSGPINTGGATGGW